MYRLYICTSGTLGLYICTRPKLDTHKHPPSQDPIQSQHACMWVFSPHPQPARKNRVLSFPDFDGLYYPYPTYKKCTVSQVRVRFPKPFKTCEVPHGFYGSGTIHLHASKHEYIFPCIQTIYQLSFIICLPIFVLSQS